MSHEMMGLGMALSHRKLRTCRWFIIHPNRVALIDDSYYANQFPHVTNPLKQAVPIGVRLNWTLWRVEVTHCVGREFPAHGIWFPHGITRGPNESLSNIHYRILSQRKSRNLRFKFHRKQLSSRCYSRAFHQAERSINSITAMKSISH